MITYVVRHPGGTVSRKISARPMTHAVVSGPADPETYATAVLAHARVALAEFDRLSDVEADSMASGAIITKRSDITPEFVYDKDGKAWPNASFNSYVTHRATLPGWDYPLYCNAEGVGQNFLYLKGSLDTTAEPRVGPIADQLRNHLHGTQRALRRTAAADTDLVNRLEAGETVLLGQWQVLRWCRSEAAAVLAMDDLKGGVDWGHPIEVVRTEWVPAEVVEVPLAVE